MCRFKLETYLVCGHSLASRFGEEESIWWLGSIMGAVSRPGLIPERQPTPILPIDSYAPSPVEPIEDPIRDYSDYSIHLRHGRGANEEAGADDYFASGALGHPEYDDDDGASNATTAVDDGFAHEPSEHHSSSASDEVMRDYGDDVERDYSDYPRRSLAPRRLLRPDEATRQRLVDQIGRVSSEDEESEPGMLGRRGRRSPPHPCPVGRGIHCIYFQYTEVESKDETCPRCLTGAWANDSGDDNNDDDVSSGPDPDDTGSVDGPPGWADFRRRNYPAQERLFIDADRALDFGRHMAGTRRVT